jgi:hypothetical protein
VLLAIVVDDVVATLSDSFDCREAGVTAFVAFVPVCVSAFVASWTAPTAAVVALVIETVDPEGPVVTTIGAVPETAGLHARFPDPSV